MSAQRAADGTPAEGTAFEPTAAGASVLDLTIPSDVNAIVGVVDAIVARCSAYRYPRRLCALNIPVAVSEALANAVVRANRQRADRQVRVHAVVDDAQLVVDVQDEGEAFDIESYDVDPTTPERLDGESGRGLFLMRRLTDRVERFAAVPSGNVVRLTLRRA